MHLGLPPRVGDVVAELRGQVGDEVVHVGPLVDVHVDDPERLSRFRRHPLPFPSVTVLQVG